MEDRLKKFVALVNSGGFSAAARELHLSQPALSVSVAKLERELRAPLLVHGVRPLTLTPAGRLAYAAGKDLEVRTSNLGLQLAELAGQPVEVSLGMIDSVASALLASPADVDLLERHATVSLVVDNSRNLLRAVEEARLDMAWVVERPQLGEMLEVIERAVEPLIVVGDRALVAATNQAVGGGRLPRFISYDQASTTRRLVAEALQRRSITAEAAFYSTSPEVMLRLVRLGKGIAALPYAQVRSLLTTGAVRAVGGEAPLLIKRPLVAVKRRDALLAAPLTQTIRRVTDLFDAAQSAVREPDKTPR